MPFQERPKWMLWWAVRVYVAEDPASSRKHDGEYVSRRTDQGSRPSRSR